MLREPFQLSESFLRPASVFIFQVDFPSLAFDTVYKIPQAANCLVHHSIETLEKNVKERLLAILAKDGTLGYVHLL